MKPAEPKRELRVPGAGDEIWSVTRRNGGSKLGTVVAKGWSYAVEAALAKFHVEKHEIEVDLVTEKKP